MGSAVSAERQRRCACGGLVDPTGGCAACRAKRRTGQRTSSEEPRSLDTRTRAIMEPRLGHDFGRVRVHTGPAASASARAIGANAFTVGSDIVFGAGRYQPETPRGRMLLAHELAHTVQQTPAVPGVVTVSRPHDACEREATGAAARVSEGEAAPIVQRTGLAVQGDWD